QQRTRVIDYFGCGDQERIKFSKLISAGDTLTERYGCIIFSSFNIRYWLCNEKRVSVASCGLFRDSHVLCCV
ncbi:hypothetical protein NL676_032933, partial [Syzygium grande]